MAFMGITREIYSGFWGKKKIAGSENCFDNILNINDF